MTLNRKVPVIVDDNGPDGKPVTLWESGAILIYLAEKGGRLLPQRSRDRLITLQWLFWQVVGVGPMFSQSSHSRYFAPEPKHAYARARYATEVKRLYDVAEARLSQSAFLGGEDYSIADIAAWPWLHRLNTRGVDGEKLPATQRWADAIGNRPAVLRAMRVVGARAQVDIQQIMHDNPDAVDRYVLRGNYSRP